MPLVKSYDDADIVSSYEVGYSLKEISEKFYIHKSTVRSALVKNGVKIRPRGGGHPQHYRLSHREVDRTLFLYYHTDLSIKEIAKTLGLASSTVYGRLHRLGIDPVRKISRRGKVITIS